MLVLTCINYWMVWYTVPIFSSSFHFIAEFKRVRNIRSYVLSISEVYAVTRFIIFSSDTYNKVQPISVHGNCKKENTEAMRSGLQTIFWYLSRCLQIRGFTDYPGLHLNMSISPGRLCPARVSMNHRSLILELNVILMYKVCTVWMLCRNTIKLVLLQFKMFSHWHEGNKCSSFQTRELRR